MTADDMCKIVYTSGTTGPPKGCVLSHGNYRAMLDMAEEVNILGPGETTFLFLPLAHVFALLIQYGTLDVGGRIAFWERDQLRIVPSLSEIKPDNFPSVPRIFEKVHRRRDRDLDRRWRPQAGHLQVGDRVSAARSQTSRSRARNPACCWPGNTSWPTSSCSARSATSSVGGSSWLSPAQRRSTPRSSGSSTPPACRFSRPGA